MALQGRRIYLASAGSGGGRAGGGLPRAAAAFAAGFVCALLLAWHRCAGAAGAQVPAVDASAFQCMCLTAGLHHLRLRTPPPRAGAAPTSCPQMAQTA